MNENYILLKTEQQQDLESILMDLANLYLDTSYVKGMQLYRKVKQPDLFMICFSNSPDLARFSYFVNYLVYPIDYPKFEPKVRGYFQTKDVVKPPTLKTGTWLMFYINRMDDAADNVYITNESGEAFIYDFGGRLQQIESPIEDYQDYAVNKEHYQHVLDIYPDPSASSMESKPWWKFW